MFKKQRYVEAIYKYAFGVFVCTFMQLDKIYVHVFIYTYPHVYAI